MQQLFYFIRKFRYFLLFLFLEMAAVYLTAQQHLFHQSKIINSANAISGGLYEKFHSVNEYFHLRAENKLLSEENIRLKNALGKREISNNNVYFTVNDTINYFQKYQYTSAKIINNNYTKRNNYLTMNKGSDQGINTEMGVVTDKGIIGVVKNVSNNFATVLSILNKNSKINVRFKKNEYFGTLVWNGKDYRIMQIVDIPRQAEIKPGDTIISGGKSAIFPEGIPVGVIKNSKFKNNQYTEINVILFNDMSALGYVEIIQNLQKEEQRELEKTLENE